MRLIFGFLLIFISLPTLAQTRSLLKEDYDHLDGKGPSGKRVKVVEWQGNLEIQIYPANSLAGMALKLDESQPDKKVMVIGLRFKNKPDQQIIRRSTLDIPFREDFHAYHDPNIDEYDKIVISNHVLDEKQLVAYTLDPAPTRLYAEGSMEKVRVPTQRAIAVNPLIYDTTYRGPSSLESKKPAIPVRGAVYINRAPYPEFGTLPPTRW